MQHISSDAIRQTSKIGNNAYAHSVSTNCPHCGERVVFTSVQAQHDAHRSTVNSTANCPACKKKAHFWSIQTRGAAPADQIAFNVYMYPAAKKHYPYPDLDGAVPDRLQRSLQSTIDALNSRNYPATAVCARRTLEGIFKYLVNDPTKQKQSLARLIETVKSEVDLAKPLTTLSHALRDGGNLGAHFDPESEPDEKLAQQMVELVDYLVSYLYVLPGKIKALEESLETTPEGGS